MAKVETGFAELHIVNFRHPMAFPKMLALPYSIVQILLYLTCMIIQGIFKKYFIKMSLS